MGRLATTGAIRVKLVALQHHEENPIRTHLGIHPTRTSAHTNDHDAWIGIMTRTNQGTQERHPGGVTTSPADTRQRNKIHTVQRKRQSLARRNTPEAPLQHHETSPKVVRTLQGSHQSLRRSISSRAPKWMEDPQRLPRIPLDPLQRNREARPELPGTPARPYRWRTRMGSRADHRTSDQSQKEAILGPMERLRPSS